MFATTDQNHVLSTKRSSYVQWWCMIPHVQLCNYGLPRVLIPHSRSTPIGTPIDKQITNYTNTQTNLSSTVPTRSTYPRSNETLELSPNRAAAWPRLFRFSQHYVLYQSIYVSMYNVQRTSDTHIYETYICLRTRFSYLCRYSLQSAGMGSVLLG